MARPHYNRQQLLQMCNQVARERRMADRSPWTAMNIIFGYTLLKCKDFKGKRIYSVSQAVDAYENKYEAGEIDLNLMSKKLVDDYAGFSVEYVPYTEKDIVFKKGTFHHWLDSRQLEPQNRINEFACRYMIFFFTVLAEKYGYREKRLNAVYEELQKHMELYKNDKVSIRQWQKELYDDAGIWFELPKDPLTQTTGSIMTGL